MFISYTKAQSIDKLSCLFVTDLDCCTADAEHRRQQRWHIYVVYVPSHALCPWFGMSAMFRAMAAEVWWVLISTLRFQGFWGPFFVSQALDLLFWWVFFCTLLEWDYVLESSTLLFSFGEWVYDPFLYILPLGTNLSFWAAEYPCCML